MIPFNKPFMTGRELRYIADAHDRGRLAGDGEYTRRCHDALQRLTLARKVLLTQSCTSALEMAAILCDIKPGDEVILPSYTFVSTANAFVLRGAVPVFSDVRADTLNTDAALIEPLITHRTRAIVVVHYAGVVCDMDPILALAAKHGLNVVEDAAQALMSTYKGKPAGTLGRFGTFSFHETKNVICGEGGALAINEANDIQRAEIVREKGTDRSRFFRGEVDKYTWCDVGSSFLPGEITAAFLFAQLESAGEITQRRLNLWHQYHQAFADLEADGLVQRPGIPADCAHNAHMYYLVLRSAAERTDFIAALLARGVHSVFHYVPLHSSPYGSQFGGTVGNCENAQDLAARLVRLPLWIGLEPHQERVIEAARDFFGRTL